MTNKVWLIAVTASLLAGCAAHRAGLPPPPILKPGNVVIPEVPSFEAVQQPDYVDLRAGGWLRVTTPLLKSGGYLIKTTAGETSGNTVTLSAADLEGYETALYSIRPRAGGGVRIELSSAEATKGGRTVSQARPAAFVFEVSREARFVRLLYLVRVSRADHDMAVIAADNAGLMDALTDAVRAHPEACRSDAHTLCFWIPRGIAVRPEETTTAP